MKNNLKREMKRWMKHWYLGGGSSFNRRLLPLDIQKEERKYYREILATIDQSISDDAAVLS